MSDYMNEGYGESLATIKKMESIGTNEEIIAKAMEILGITEVPSYFKCQQGAFLPHLGAFRAFTLLTEGKEALLRNVLCRTQCGEASREEIADLIGEAAMTFLEVSNLHQEEINLILEEQQRRSDEVAELGSAWRRSRAEEDKRAWDRAAELNNKRCSAEHHTSSRSVMLRDEAFKKMLEVMK